MLPTPEAACFVIADISGYTRFLAGVELDHAQDIVADVMDTVVKALRPPFRLAKFEGDAAFLYAADDKVDGSGLQDAIETAYFMFRRRLRNIRQATSCTCQACHRMGDLDLKFVAHCGTFVRQRMGGREELAGRDVIVVHRLLKNTVNERLAGHAYALYSEGCRQRYQIDVAAQGLIEHGEAIDIIGDVTCWLRDLEAAWLAENERRRTQVAADEAALVLAFDLPAPRPMVWDYFTSPELRPQWRAATEVREDVRRGRRGTGTTNHCVHGADVIIEEILDWRPFDYLTLTTLLPIPGAPKIPMTYLFTDSGAGTRAEIRVGRPKSKDKGFLEAAASGFKERFLPEIAVLQQILQAESRAAAAAASDAPELHSEHRFLTQPVLAGTHPPHR